MEKNKNILSMDLNILEMDLAEFRDGVNNLLSHHGDIVAQLRTWEFIIMNLSDDTEVSRNKKAYIRCAISILSYDSIEMKDLITKPME